MQSSLEPSLVAKLLVRTSSLRCDFVQLGGWQKESSFVIPACWEVFPNEQTWHFPRIPLEHGGKWNGDDIVADLEDFKRDAERASYSSGEEDVLFTEGTMDVSDAGGV